jgi:hypothetical protein
MVLRWQLSTHIHGTVKKKTDWRLESLRNISDLVPIGMCMSVHYTVWDACGDFKATTTEPSTSVAPLKQWSASISRSPRLSWPWNYNWSRMPKYFAKQKSIHRFVMIIYVYSRTTALQGLGIRKSKLKIKWFNESSLDTWFLSKLQITFPL